MTIYIFGNWKMNLTADESVSLATNIQEQTNTIPEIDVCISVFPALPNIYPVYDAINGGNILIGAQNIHTELSGSFTGETSVAMLDGVCAYLLVGHSERRALFQESNANINSKIALAIDFNIRPVLCVGELDYEDNPGVSPDSILSSQLNEALHGLPASKITEILFAYEPLSAIGTGTPMSPELVDRKLKFIKETVAFKSGSTIASKDVAVMYGGSVTPDNATSYLELKSVDGLLVGGASLVAGSFIEICHLAGN